jgi:hypothetical protein
MIPSTLKLTTWLLATLAATALAAAPPPQTPSPTPEERVAILKQWLAASKTQLARYEWVETTVIAKDGQEQSRTQNTCYYGVEGDLQKVPMAGGTEKESKEPPGILMPGKLLKKAEEHEKKEMQTYMENATALVHQYVPPDPALIQQAVDSGNFSVSPQGSQVRLTFRNYLKPNDALNVDIEVPTNRLIGMSVASYLGDAKDAIQLDVRMGLLPDGTIFMQESTLNAPAKKVTVTVDNSGYHLTSG